MTFARIKPCHEFCTENFSVPYSPTAVRAKCRCIATAETAAGDVAAGTRMQELSEKSILGSCCPSQMIAVLAAFQQVPP